MYNMLLLLFSGMDIADWDNVTIMGIFWVVGKLPFNMSACCIISYLADNVQLNFNQNVISLSFIWINIHMYFFSSIKTDFI